jgi:hypothetical protein
MPVNRRSSSIDQSAKKFQIRLRLDVRLAQMADESLKDVTALSPNLA